jgi:hypothetical protein
MSRILPTEIKPNHRARKATAYVGSIPKKAGRRIGVAARTRGQEDLTCRGGRAAKATEVSKGDDGPGGTPKARRRRWQRLLRLVAHGAVRIILVSEESR